MQAILNLHALTISNQLYFVILLSCIYRFNHNGKIKIITQLINQYIAIDEYGANGVEDKGTEVCYFDMGYVTFHQVIGLYMDSDPPL